MNAGAPETQSLHPMNALGLSSAEVVQERRWEPRRGFRTAIGLALLSTCIDLLDTAQRAAGLQQRAMRLERRRVLEAVVADTLHRHFLEPGCWVRVDANRHNISKRGLIVAPAECRALAGMLKTMATHGLIEHRPGYSPRFDGPDPEESGARQTTIRATPKLISLAAGAGVTRADLMRADGGQALKLRPAGTRPTWQDAWAGDSTEDDDHEAEGIAFEATPETIAMQEEMDRINAHLQRAAINLDPAWSPAPGERSPDPDQRFLTRIFSRGRFDDGGRLYGGFWINMPKEDRRAIRIEGEKVAVLDYAALGVRMLYALADQHWPVDLDPYALPDHPDWPRDAVKVVLNAMISDAKAGRRSFPKAEPGEAPWRSFFPDGVKVGEVIAALEERHTAIRGWLYHGMAHELQRRDSDLMVKVLLRTIDLGIVGLPIHDALIVRQSEATIAKTIMEEMFSDTCGSTCPVVLKIPIAGSG